MTAIHSFLNIEESLSTRLHNVWMAKVGNPAQREVGKLIREDRFEEAFTVANALTLDLRSQEGFVRNMALAAFSFGQTLFAKGRAADTELAKGRMAFPLQIDTATEAVLTGLDLNGAEGVRLALLKVIEEARAEPVVQKAAIPGLAAKLNAAVAGGSSAAINAGANLTTTRLVAFGSLTEANARGKKTFQITEILDGRTCKVCRRMHGKVFSIASPLSRLQTQLSTTNPLDLKGAYPFPKQSQAGLEELTSLNNSELDGRGWSTPPFHPACRGTVVPVGTVPPSERIPFRPPPRRPPPKAPPSPRLPTVGETPKIPEKFRRVSDGINKKIKGPKAKQTTADLDELYAAAGEADPILQTTVRELAERFGGEPLFPPGLKGRVRVIEKANAKYGGDFAAITDFSRATIVFEDLEGVYATLEALPKAGIRIVRIGDRFFNPTAEGYSDIILNVRMANGHVAELQLHVRSVSAAKDANHVLYERQRTILARAKTEGRDMTLAEMSEVKDLVVQQQRVYGSAMQQALRIQTQPPIFPQQSPSNFLRGILTNPITPIATTKEV